MDTARFKVKFSDDSETTYTEDNMLTELSKEGGLAKSVEVIEEELPEQPKIS